jgi:septum formation protein
MLTAPMRILLASTSPRRSDLLARAGIAFARCEPGPEPAADGTPEQRAVARARSKAQFAAAGDSLLPRLGVDTVVDVDGRELGKPADSREAAAMLQHLRGRRHLVHTAHCLVDPRSGRVHEALATSTVECAGFDAAALARYLDGLEWRGKAGSYGIQDRTQDFLQVVDGAYDTVVGLHVPAVRRLLAQLEVGR